MTIPDPVGPDTGNDRLQNGVNRCPKCGSTDVLPKPGTDTLMCLFCRYAWSEARVEERFGLGDGIGDLRGVQLASGARDELPARRFREAGTTLFLVSHDPTAIKNLCDRAIILEDGVMIRDGRPDDDSALLAVWTRA